MNINYTVSVGNIDNLFWTNGSEAKPITIPDTSKFKILTNIKINWETPLTGIVELTGVYNYLVWKGEYYFLRVYSVRDVEKSLYGYYLAKDLWCSFIMRKAICKGVISRTSNLKLLVDNLQLTKSPLVSPNKVLYYNSEVLLEKFNTTLNRKKITLQYNDLQLFTDKTLKKLLEDIRGIKTYKMPENWTVTKKTQPSLLTKIHLQKLPHFKNDVIKLVNNFLEDELGLYTADRIQQAGYGKLAEKIRGTQSSPIYFIKKKNDISQLGSIVENNILIDELDLSKCTDVIWVDPNTMSEHLGNRLLTDFISDSIPYNEFKENNPANTYTLVEKQYVGPSVQSHLYDSPFYNLYIKNNPALPFTGVTSNLINIHVPKLKIRDNVLWNNTTSFVFGGCLTNGIDVVDLGGYRDDSSNLKPTELSYYIGDAAREYSNPIASFGGGLCSAIPRFVGDFNLTERYINNKVPDKELFSCYWMKSTPDFRGLVLLNQHTKVERNVLNLDYSLLSVPATSDKEKCEYSIGFPLFRIYNGITESNFCQARRPYLYHVNNILDKDKFKEHKAPLDYTYAVLGLNQRILNVYNYFRIDKNYKIYYPSDGNTIKPGTDLYRTEPYYRSTLIGNHPQANLTLPNTSTLTYKAVTDGKYSIDFVLDYITEPNFNDWFYKTFYGSHYRTLIWNSWSTTGKLNKQTSRYWSYTWDPMNDIFKQSSLLDYKLLMINDSLLDISPFTSQNISNYNPLKLDLDDEYIMHKFPVDTAENGDIFFTEYEYQWVKNITNIYDFTIPNNGVIHTTANKHLSYNYTLSKEEGEGIWLCYLPLEDRIHWKNPEFTNNVCTIARVTYDSFKSDFKNQQNIFDALYDPINVKFLDDVNITTCRVSPVKIGKFSLHYKSADEIKKYIDILVDFIKRPYIVFYTWTGSHTKSYFWKGHEDKKPIRKKRNTHGGLHIPTGAVPYTYQWRKLKWDDDEWIESKKWTSTLYHKPQDSFAWPTVLDEFGQEQLNLRAIKELEYRVETSSTFEWWNSYYTKIKTTTIVTLPISDTEKIEVALAYDKAEDLDLLKNQIYADYNTSTQTYFNSLQRIEDALSGCLDRDNQSHLTQYYGDYLNLSTNITTGNLDLFIANIYNKLDLRIFPKTNNPIKKIQYNEALDGLYYLKGCGCYVLIAKHNVNIILETNLHRSNEYKKIKVLVPDEFDDYDLLAQRNTIFAYGNNYPINEKYQFINELILPLYIYHLTLTDVKSELEYYQLIYKGEQDNIRDIITSVKDIEIIDETSRFEYDRLQIEMEQFKQQKALDMTKHNINKISYLDKYKLNKEQLELDQRKQITGDAFGIVNKIIGGAGQIAVAGVAAKAIGGPYAAAAAVGIGLAKMIPSVAESGVSIWQNSQQRDLTNRQFSLTHAQTIQGIAFELFSLNHNHKYTALNYELQLNQLSNNYSEITYSNQKITESINKKLGLTPIHLITYLPSEYQKTELKKYIQMFGLETNIHNQRFFFDELTDEYVYKFEKISEWNITLPPEERELIEGCLKNGIRLVNNSV